MKKLTGLTRAILNKRVDELTPPFFCEIAFEKERSYIYGMLCVLLNEEFIDKEEYDSIANKVQSIKFVMHKNKNIGENDHV